MLIKTKFEGYSRDGVRLYPCDDGGGGSSAPSTQTQISELPEWAKPYAKNALEKGAALSETPYQAYGGERIAGFSPLQQQAQAAAGPQGFQNTVGQYMSPYQQNVTDVQKQEAARQSGIAGTQQAAQATQAGAFGGGRDAIMRAERERNLGRQMNDIQAVGSQNAFNNATQQYNTGLQQMSAFGGQQQALRQQGLSQAYGDFQEQKNYPYKQLGFMSDMIRGLPLGQQSSRQMYENPGSMLGQVAGLGTGLYAASQAFKADGGLTESYADGGSVESAGNIEAIVSKLSDQQLQQSMEAAQARGDQAQMQIIQAEMAMRASERNGMAGAYNSLPQETQEGMAEMAGGGVVAFADEGLVRGQPLPERATSPMGDFLRSSGIEDALVAAREAFYKKSENDRRTADAINLYPGLTEALTPDERKRRIAARDRMAAGDQPTKPLSQAELAAKQQEFRSGVSESPYSAKSATLLDADDAESYAKQLGKGQKQEGKTSNPNSVVGQAKAAAKAAGVPAEDFEATMRRLRKEFGGEDNDYKKEMLDQYKKATERLTENKSKAGYEALANFGFNMAAQAAKPGQARRSGIAGALESAAAASPVFTQSMAESNKVNRAAEDNLDKMRTDQLRFEQSLASNDRQSAMQYANAISQDKKTQEMLDIERKKLGILGQQAANASGTALQKIADDLQRADPSLDRRAALGEASKIAGYSYRQEAANQGRLAETIRKIDEKFNMLDMLPPDSDIAKQMRGNRDRQIAEAKRQFGGEMQAGAGTIKLDSKGNIIQ
jgi:hypothetical protein